jgi:hypothetical protein
MVVASFCGLRERFFLNVAARKRVHHSARGDPATGGVVVWEVKRVEGRRWGSVISIWGVSTIDRECKEIRRRTEREQLDFELLAKLLWVRG